MQTPSPPGCSSGMQRIVAFVSSLIAASRPASPDHHTRQKSPASIAWFGLATWDAFLAAVAASGDVYAGHAIFMGGLTSPFGALMAFGVDRHIAFVVGPMCAIQLCAISIAR